MIEKVDEKIDIKEEIYEIDIDKFKSEATDCETETPDFICDDIQLYIFTSLCHVTFSFSKFCFC